MSSEKKQNFVLDVISSGILALAVFGYRLYPGTAWTEIADMILRVWCGLLMGCALILWSVMHFEPIRELFVDSDMLRTISRYNEKRSRSGSVISYSTAALFAIYIGIAYFAADAQRYGIAGVVMIFLGLLALTLKAVSRIPRI